ncbi:MAG: hypothetical protein EOP07_12270 [Proteobacteria bacterium]|nr:MAG: hypothetical protein EOP07_12270 [Pseudomonadota bacterium]
MKRHSKGTRQEGFAAIALIMGVTIISLASMYVVNQSKTTVMTTRAIERDRARAASELSNLSNLGWVRGLIALQKVDDPKTPAIYPENYFASPWKMLKNVTAERPLEFIEAENNQLWLPTYAAGSLSIDKAMAIFTGLKGQLEMLTEAQNVEIVSNNLSAKHNFYVESIDIKTKRPLDLASAGAGSDVETTGRINLNAPVPYGFRVLVKLPGEMNFRPNLSSIDGEHAAGDYVFQLRGSGIIHHGEIDVGGTIYPVGLDENGRITHKAVNIMADDVVIGEVSVHIGGGQGPNFENAEVKFDSCRILVEPVSSAAGAAGPGAGSAVRVKARIYDVKNEVPAYPLALGADPKTPPVYMEEESTLIVSGGSGSGVSGSQATGLGCEDKCPYDFRKDFWIDPMTQARFMDLTVTGETDTKKLDYFDEEITGVIIQKTKGIVCSNMELVGDAMHKADPRLPSALIMANRDLYEELRNKNLLLKRFFAYTAPSCERKLIGERTVCGCFAEDTLILMGDGSEKAIRDITEGDEVQNPLTGKIQSVKRVVAGPEKIPMYRVLTAIGSVLVTRQHPFLTRRGSVTAEDLRADDLIATGSDNQFKEILSIDSVPWDETKPAPIVWNLELVGSDDFSEHYVQAGGVMTGDLFIQETLGKK